MTPGSGIPSLNLDLIRSSLALSGGLCKQRLFLQRLLSRIHFRSGHPLITSASLGDIRLEDEGGEDPIDMKSQYSRSRLHMIPSPRFRNFGSGRDREYLIIKRGVTDYEHGSIALTLNVPFPGNNCSGASRSPREYGASPFTLKSKGLTFATLPLNVAPHLQKTCILEEYYKLI